jgi:hypothetical protein
MERQKSFLILEKYFTNQITIKNYGKFLPLLEFFMFYVFLFLSELQF